jgi:hypothetical protein
MAPMHLTHQHKKKEIPAAKLININKKCIHQQNILLSVNDLITIKT